MCFLVEEAYVPGNVLNFRWITIVFLQCVGKWAVVNNYKIKSRRNKKISKFFKLSSLPRYNLTFLKTAEE
jgi:hypothetical protein